MERWLAKAGPPEIESCHFNITGIYCPDEGILNFTKALELFTIVDLNDEHNFLVLSVKGIQAHNNLLIVTVTGSVRLSPVSQIFA
jgi:uncharacterized protein YqkB